VRARSLLVALSLVSACTEAAEPALPDPVDGVRADDKADNATAIAVCNAIPTPRPWTADETTLLLERTVERFSEMKRENDALIARRGVGAYAGVKTEVMKAIDRRDYAAAAAIIRPKLKPGFDANVVAREIAGTSCIGRVYAILRDVYAELGRTDEWKAIEKCGRAWQSDGLHVQQALIKNGWPAPALPFVSDALDLPGSTSEVAVHQEFLRAVGRGSYYGTPVSTTAKLENFLPSPGSSTPKQDAALLSLGRSQFLAVGTLRGAFHVPLIVPAATIGDEFLTTSAARTARDRGEPFVMESHSLRQPWDPTNFEIRPLTEVIAETLPQSVIYATGTILLAPFAERSLADISAGVGGGVTEPTHAGCYSSVLRRDVPHGACIQRPSDSRWFRCTDGDWAASSADDTACTESHPL